MGIISIPFCLGVIGIVFPRATLIRSGKAVFEFKKNPILYPELSYKKSKAVRTCAMVSSSVLGVALFITMALTVTN